MEAAAQGIELGPHDWAIRCNLVTIVDGKMRSFTAEQIPDELGSHLIEVMQKAVAGDPRWEFHAGVSYRNLLIFRNPASEAPFDSGTETTPPHDITDQAVQEFLPRGTGAQLLKELMKKSEELFAADERNLQREQSGSLRASGIWLWGQGSRPALEAFSDRYRVRGAVITAVDLLRGLGRLLGWKVVEVPGATGYLDTDYAAKGQYAIDTLTAGADFVVVHVEAPDEASHEGDTAAKITALENMDRHIVGPLHQYLQSQGEYRLLISPDHPTFLRTKTHSHGYVPIAVAGNGIAADSATTYDEISAASGETFSEGYRLMERFLHG